MAFSDLCHIGNAYKSVENEPDQSDRIMEENSMVRDLITKILDEGGPESTSSLQPPEKTTSLNAQAQYQKPDGPFPYYQNNYNYPQNDQQFNNYNGYTNGFYNDNVLGVEPVETNDVSPEQLNLLRLAAQEIGGAQFNTPNKFENYNYFDQQRSSMPENVYPNFSRPNNLNLDMSYNKFDNPNPYMQRFPQNGLRENQETTELLSFINNMQRDEVPVTNSMEFKLPEVNFTEEVKIQDPKLFFNRSFPAKNVNNENFFMKDIAQMVERPPPNFDSFNQNQMNYKPNGYNGHQNEFMRVNQQRDGYPNGVINDPRSFENGQPNSNNIQQAVLLRQNQELARQMSLLMRNRPPPNPLNVDVSFLHENPQFNLGIGALLGPSPNVPPPVLPSPMVDMPLAPFYTMRNMRGAVTSSGILHARLDACYEQWRQLERERKRTEARLALAYPGRAVSSSNSIPVPRLPPCPTRVDRLTVDMLREHTKVLTLMGKMETLRASVCVAQNKKPNKEDTKITVLKRGQQNVENKEKEGLDPNTFDPASWREHVTHLSEIAPHSEVENAMLAWRSAVGMVQLARRRELQNTPRYPPTDPILQLAEAVKQLGICARRARCAMWCDLTLTVALAPTNNPLKVPSSEHSPNYTIQPSKPVADQGSTSKTNGEPKESQEKETPSDATNTEKPQENNNNSKTTNKNEKPENKRRQQNYKKTGRNDFYQKNQRYDSRFMPNRHPYYLATASGPIN